MIFVVWLNCEISFSHSALSTQSDQLMLSKEILSCLPIFSFAGKRKSVSIKKVKLVSSQVPTFFDWFVDDVDVGWWIWTMKCETKAKDEEIVFSFVMTDENSVPWSWKNWQISNYERVWRMTEMKWNWVQVLGESREIQARSVSVCLRQADDDWIEIELIFLSCFAFWSFFYWNFLESWESHERLGKFQVLFVFFCKLCTRRRWRFCNENFLYRIFYSANIWQFERKFWWKFTVWQEGLKMFERNMFIFRRLFRFV